MLVHWKIGILMFAVSLKAPKGKQHYVRDIPGDGSDGEDA